MFRSPCSSFSLNESSMSYVSIAYLVSDHKDQDAGFIGE